MKQLTQHYGPMQIASLRALFAWPLIVGWLITTNRVQHLLNSRWSLHLLRAVLGIVMLSAFVYAIQTLSLSDAYAI
ncbi:MAG: EamA/RhaT family transporter, partial [Pararheinheimera sp.]|nr:EamA/RhaT family transporter [Rheinheimera sp.]